MEEQEKYIGGVTSGHLRKGFLEGYAIHVTTKRIIGTKRSGYGFIAGGILGSKSVEHEREEESKLQEGDNAGEEMKKLLESKDIEIRKQEIKQITLKRVGTLRNGHLIITPQSGKEIKIEIMPQDRRHIDPLYPGSRLFERIGELMQAFYPEVVQLED